MEKEIIDLISEDNCISIQHIVCDSCEKSKLIIIGKLSTGELLVRCDECGSLTQI